MGRLRQIYLKKAGNSCVWDIRDQEVPDHSPQRGNVRVKIQYSGLNFADVMMKLGLYPDAPALPYIPGYEFSGVITHVGEDVDKLRVGQRVCGGSNFGAYQSSLELAADQVIGLPSNLNMEQGAALIVSFITAYSIFCQLSRVRSSDRVLIDCATGALGRISIELLQHLGVKEITALTRSPEKLRYLQDLGVKGRLHQDMENMLYNDYFDVILNSRGGISIRKDYKRLAKCSTMVVIGASSMVKNGKKNYFSILKELWGMRGLMPVTLMNDNRGIMGLNVLRLFDRDDMSCIEEALDFLKEHPIFEPRVDKVFANEDVEKALAYLGSGQSCGKVLLKW